MEKMSWNLVEKNIIETIDFLKNNILLSPYKQNDAIKCSECIFRQISILIVSGRVKVRKIKYKQNSIWNYGKYFYETNRKNHGAEWHNSLIRIIEEYFTSHNYSVSVEPSLHYGRSDLGVKQMNLYIEVGTINIYKLLINLLNMNDCKIAIVPSDDYLLEFIL